MSFSRAKRVLGIPNGDSVVVSASNYGQSRHPSWYYNLRSDPKASVVVAGHRHDVRAHEARGGERERLWRLGLEVYPGWRAYERRASNRRIPVMVLSPVSETEPSGTGYRQ